MTTWLKWAEAIGSALHWLTGWIVHPKKGGCCEQEKIKDDLEKVVKED